MREVGDHATSVSGGDNLTTVLVSTGAPGGSVLLSHRDAPRLTAGGLTAGPEAVSDLTDLTGIGTVRVTMPVEDIHDILRSMGVKSAVILQESSSARPRSRLRFAFALLGVVFACGLASAGVLVVLWIVGSPISDPYESLFAFLCFVALVVTWIHGAYRIY